MVRAINIGLCAVGVVVYLITLGWAAIGVWPLCFYTLSKIWLVMNTGLPAPIATSLITLPVTALAAYYSLASPLIARVFARVPIMRPVLLVGFVFFVGLTAAHIILDQLIEHGLTSRPVIFAVGAAGILLTRVSMSWLFWKFPVEALSAAE